MLSLNATICQRNGGKPGKPDQLNTHIRMPTPDYDLAESQCAGIVKVRALTTYSNCETSLVDADMCRTSSNTA